MTTNGHWTSGSARDLQYAVALDFVAQIERFMETRGITRQDMAGLLNVQPSRVSQVLNDPGNMTVKLMVDWARALGLKLCVLTYDDGDPHNEKGPINSQVFAECWQRTGKPADAWDLERCGVAEHREEASNPLRRIDSARPIPVRLVWSAERDPGEPGPRSWRAESTDGVNDNLDLRLVAAV